jgi:Sensors of blue-light using FAD
MEDLIRVIYVNAPAPETSEQDTAEFLKEARKSNRKNDVSGMMLYVGGCLLLLLEGEAPKVDAAFQEIAAPKRGLRAIHREPVAEREFPDWIMGFEAVAPAEVARLLGKPLVPDFATRLAHIDPQSAMTLFSIIGRRRWQSDRSGMFRAIRRTTGTVGR